MPDKIATIDLEVASEEQTFDATFHELENSLNFDTGTVIQLAGTDYDNLKNKPKINGVELAKNKSFTELGLTSITTLGLINLWNSVDD